MLEQVPILEESLKGDSDDLIADKSALPDDCVTKVSLMDESTSPNLAALEHLKYPLCLRSHECFPFVKRVLRSWLSR